MSRLASTLRESWEKNWPELRCALSGGLPRFVMSRSPEPPGLAVPVFCYHAVDPGPFEQDLDFLRTNGYTTITADALLDHMKRQDDAPESAVVLTFDDGPVNLYEVVYPLLERFDMCAFAFIAPCFHAENEAELVTGAFVGESRSCTWPEIRTMHESGRLDVQSHTFEHRYVPRWPEPAELIGAPDVVQRSRRREPLSLADDFSRSRTVLEEKLGKRVRHLAFPRCNGTEEAIAVGRRAGLEGFWWGTLPSRPANAPGDDPTRIVRVSGEFLRRLPGEGRTPLARILGARYGASVGRRLRRADDH